MASPKLCNECKGRGFFINERKRVVVNGKTVRAPQYYVACPKCKARRWI